MNVKAISKDRYFKKHKLVLCWVKVGLTLQIFIKTI